MSMNNSAVNFFRIIGSVLSAAIGIQSSKNRNRDFQADTPVKIYVLVGLAFTFLFVLMVYFIVKAVLS